jgi:hypothetical protein
VRKKFLSFAVLVCFIVFAQTSIVSAQLPNFKPYFDSRLYELGSTGTVIFDIQTFDVAFDIGTIGITLYFPKIDGTTFETEFFGKDYGENPLQIPANNKTSLPINFIIPDRTDLKSGHFAYLFEVDIKPQNATTYSHETYGPEEAIVYGEYCIIYNPESLPSPNPTSEPTLSPLPTNSSPLPTATTTPENTDYNKPGDTITLTPTEIALIAAIAIAVVLGIIAIWALKRK